MKKPLFALSLFLLQSSVDAQPKQMDSTVYTASTLDLNAASVPVPYMGQDPYLLIMALGRALKPKDEFETTKEFQLRRAQALTMPIVGQLTAASTFVLKLDAKHILASYDADKGKLKVSIYYSYELFNPTLSLYSEENIVGAYKGKNAFGLEKDVAQVDRQAIRLLWRNGSKFGAKSSSLDTVDFSISVPPQRAREMKADVAALIFCSVVDPYIGLDKSVTRPSVRFPVEATNTSFFIHGNVSQIWIYDSYTGSILQKIKK